MTSSDQKSIKSEDEKLLLDYFCRLCGVFGALPEDASRAFSIVHSTVQVDFTKMEHKLAPQEREQIFEALSGRAHYMNTRHSRESTRLCGEVPNPPNLLGLMQGMNSPVKREEVWELLRALEKLQYTITLAPEEKYSTPPPLPRFLSVRGLGDSIQRALCYAPSGQPELFLPEPLAYLVARGIIYDWLLNEEGIPAGEVQEWSEGNGLAALVDQVAEDLLRDSDDEDDFDEEDEELL